MQNVCEKGEILLTPVLESKNKIIHALSFENFLFMCILLICHYQKKCAELTQSKYLIKK